MNKTAIAANELRLGNYVKAPLGEIMKVDVLGHLDNPNYIHASNETGFGQNGFEPIELTPEILEKAGWVKDWSGYNHKSRISFAITSDSKYLPCWDDRALSITIQYLHQLQTLFFCLTGEELPLTL